MVNALVERFDFKWFKTIEYHIVEYWYFLTVVLMDVPGHDCEQIGARFAVAFRRILGIYVDGATMDSRLDGFDEYGNSLVQPPADGVDDGTWKPKDEREITRGGVDKWRPKD